MQFQVPQFIEVEDKIFGPLTFKQFIYVTGGLGAMYLIWRVLPFYVAAPLMAGAGGLAAALAFLEWNGRPFILALENGFYYIVRAKLYLWNNEQKTKKQEARHARLANAPKAQVYIPKLSESRLHELAWSLDIKERIAAGVASGRDREAIAGESGVVAPIRTSREALVR